MTRIDIAPLTTWITAAATRHGDDLASYLEQRLGVGRRRALALLRRLEAAQWLRRTGTARRPRFEPGPLRQVVHSYALDGLMEDRPWRADFAPHFELTPEVARIARHAFTELVNNAIDHSGGTRVTVSMRQTALHLQLLVADDGCGLFRRVGEHFDIDDPRLAMLELTKGKLTSQPARHRGQGLYFTSRLADMFDLRANAAAFQCRAWSTQPWHETRTAAALAERAGTSVYFAIALDTPRTLEGVLRAASVDAAGYALECTRVPLHLLHDGAGALCSRAEARRAAARLAQFRRAEIDFGGVDEVGPAFADELFRVVAAEHPGLELVAHAASPRVAAMLDAARVAA